VWFSETEQKRNSLIGLYEALRSHTGSSGRKIRFDSNVRPLHDGEAEFKYVTLADDMASLSTDQTSSQSEPESETQRVNFGYPLSSYLAQLAEYMGPVEVIKVRILPTQKGKSVIIFSRLDAR
jgi:hypothetical protein